MLVTVLGEGSYRHLGAQGLLWKRVSPGGGGDSYPMRGMDPMPLNIHLKMASMVNFRLCLSYQTQNTSCALQPVPHSPARTPSLGTQPDKWPRAGAHSGCGSTTAPARCAHPPPRTLPFTLSSRDYGTHRNSGSGTWQRNTGGLCFRCDPVTSCSFCAGTRSPVPVRGADPCATTPCVLRKGVRLPRADGLPWDAPHHGGVSFKPLQAPETQVGDVHPLCFGRAPPTLRDSRREEQAPQTQS